MPDINIHLHIMQYLDIYSVVRLSQTCKFFRKVIQMALMDRSSYIFSGIDHDIIKMGYFGSELCILSRNIYLFENACDKNIIGSVCERYSVEKLGYGLIDITLNERYNTLVQSDLHVFILHLAIFNMIMDMHHILNIKNIQAKINSPYCAEFSIIEIIEYIDSIVSPNIEYTDREIVTDIGQDMLDDIHEVFTNIPTKIIYMLEYFNNLYPCDK